MINITIKPKTVDEVRIVAKKAIEETKSPSKSQVVAVFDVSGSMEFAPYNFYTSGIMEALATRVLGLGLELDDDGIIPVYTIGSGTRKLESLTRDNLDGYIEKEVLPHVPQGTEYAPAIEQILKDAKSGDPMLVLLFTDGDNSDHKDTTEAIIRASNLPIFFQWYGIFRGKSAPRFSYLEKLDEMKGRIVDNCGFSPLGLDINASLGGADDDKNLYTDMLKEYKDFPQKAVQAGVTWANKGQALPERKKLFGMF